MQQEKDMAAQRDQLVNDRLRDENLALQKTLDERQQENARLREQMEEALQGQASGEAERPDRRAGRATALRKDRSALFVGLMRLADTSALVEAVLRASNAGEPLAVDLQSVNEVWDLADGDRATRCRLPPRRAARGCTSSSAAAGR